VAAQAGEDGEQGHRLQVGRHNSVEAAPLGSGEEAQAASADVLLVELDADARQVQHRSDACDVAVACSEMTVKSTHA
jgi:hypothetical protein